MERLWRRLNTRTAALVALVVAVGVNALLFFAYFLTEPPGFLPGPPGRGEQGATQLQRTERTRTERMRPKHAERNVPGRTAPGRTAQRHPLTKSAEGTLPATTPTASAAATATASPSATAPASASPAAPATPAATAAAVHQYR